MKKLTTILFVLLFFNGGFSQLQNNIAIVSLGSESENLAKKEKSISGSYSINEWIRNKKPIKTVLGYTRQNRTVDAYYFPGTSNKKALVIGGMHGSELSSVEIAKGLIEILSEGEIPYYNVIVVPMLFPDNVEKARPFAKNQKSNFGRYTSELNADPNRQMPELGKAFDPEHPVDSYDRIIEKENQFLLQLIQEYQPSRIVNLHAIKDVTKAGIYADPRTDCNGYALGFETDSSLAVSMARFVENNGGRVPGNCLQQKSTALYYHDPEVAATGSLQKRNFHGSPIPNNRGYGVSLGGWATTAVCHDIDKRSAARLITMEFPGYKPSSAYEGKDRETCLFNIRLYTSAIRKIFLEENYVE